MSGEQLTAYLAGIGVFLGVLTRIYRSLTGDKFDRKVKESASVLSGYTDMIAVLQNQINSVREANTAEIDRLQRQHHAEIESIHRIHAQERRRWDAERDRLEERVDALEEQVTALLERPKTARARMDDE